MPNRGAEMAAPAQEPVELLFQQNWLGMALLDAQGRILEKNAALRAQWGSELASLKGRRLADLMSPEDRERFASFFAELSAGKRVSGQLDLEVRPHEGDRMDCRLGLYPAPSIHGRAAAWLAVLEDFTPEHRQEQVLAEADRCKREFLSVVSHELNTPLTRIVGFAGLLAELPEQSDGLIAEILKGAEQLTAMIRDLLDYTRLQAGQLTFEFACCRYAELTRDVLARLQPLAQERGVRLQREGDDAASVYLDRTRVEQILGHLITNALKFTPSGGKVSIRSHVEGHAVLTEVEDNGPGIPATHLENVFQAFQQEDMSNTRAAGGLGIGLALCRALVQQMGGAIGVRSVLGSGSTFWFSLPCGRQNVVGRRSPQQSAARCKLVRASQGDACPLFGTPICEMCGG